MANLIAEYWISDIQEILIKNNDIVNGVKNHTEFITGGNFVNVPQGYANPGTVLVNPDISGLPLAASNRTDENLRYSMRTLATAPQIVSNLEQVQIAYDKRQSLMRTQMTQIVNAGYDWLIYDWAKGAKDAGSSIIATSGTGRTAKNSYQTGNRKKFTVQDLWDANLKLDQQRIPREGRVLIVPTSMSRDIKEWGLEVTGGLNSDAIATELGYKGKVNVIDNTLIITRSTVALGATSAITSIYTPDYYTEVSANSAVTAASACDVAILFHPDYLSYAIGQPDVFYKEKDPQFLGDVINMMLRLGGSVVRKNGDGVVLITESL